jgi:hypothetical protein
MSRTMGRKIAFAALALMLAGCGKPQAPVGKWEGGAETGGILVAARVEIMPNGTVKISAPDITNAVGQPDEVLQMQAHLSSDLANGWPDVRPRQFDFDGKTFRKPGGYAPQMVWDKDTGQMTLELYIGANPALPVMLRPVSGFHDSPFGNG